MESPPMTPPSSPLDDAGVAAMDVEDGARSLQGYERFHDSLHATPASPPSPSSAVSASAVSATELSRSQFDMSAPVDATPAYQPDLERDISMTPQRSRLPRGDLGRTDFRLHNMPSTSGSEPRTPRSPSSSRSTSSSIHHTLPLPPASPTSSHNSFHSMGGIESGLEPPNSPGLEIENREDEYSSAVIWGTNVSLVETIQLFRRFLLNFKPEYDDSEEAYYMNVLRQMHISQNYILNLDSRHLISYVATRRLYEQLSNFPQEVIRILDMVTKDEFERLFGTPEADLRIQVRIFNLKDIHPIRDLNPSDIDQLICVSGMVIRCSPIIPDLKIAFFQCNQCSSTAEVPLGRGRIQEPTICESCNTKMSMELIHNRCSFTDKQMVKIQETPDAIPDGETPHTVTLFVFDDLVDAVRPGDKVRVTGIFRALPMRLTARQRVVKSVFKTYIDVIHFQTIDNLWSTASTQPAVKDDEHETNENNVEDINQKKVEEFRSFAQDPDVYNKLANSVAPSIWELDDVKKGILCQLFGGCDKTADGAPAGKFRADINVLLCGDPGTSKSQLLSYVHKIAPRGIYTSGKGSSAVGLTASVVRDPETGDLVLESGALVLSDQGICCIDEFDKMSDSARSVLHEVMEQQTVSIAKAGIICSLNARTSILASANPIESRYNPQKSVVENINILPTLLSRFDLIYLILDKPNQDSDRRLAKHIVSLYFETPTAPPPPISMRFLTEYIAYSKKEIHPRMSDEVARDLIQGYLDMRRMGSSKKCITATPRQLESLIRLSEASARVRLSQEVDRRDVAEAIRLINVATQKAAMDPRTGTIDMDMITTGHTATERETLKELLTSLRHMLQKYANRTIDMVDLRKEWETANDTTIKDGDFRVAIHSLADENVLQLQHNKIRVM